MPPLHDLAALAVQIATFTGSAPQLDPRLQLAACPAPVVAWAGTAHTVVSVDCPAPAWRIFVGVRTGSAGMPLVHQGDSVVVSASGAGYQVSIEGVAENDAAAGARVRVRLAGSTRLIGMVQADGSIIVPGYNSADERR